MRKGSVLAEILIGLLILSGVLVAMSEFLAYSLMTSIQAEDTSNALLDSYGQARLIASTEDLASPDLPPGASVDVSEVKATVNLVLRSGDAEVNTLTLNAYDVGKRQERPLRVYRAN